MMRSFLFLLSLCASLLAENPVSSPRNILWDGGFDTGFGNSFWGTSYGNLGPNRRSTWSEGSVILQQEVVSRLYILPEGPYTLCAWVRRAGAATTSPAVLNLQCTSFNDYESKQGDTFKQLFPVTATAAWERVGFTFDLRAPVNPFFHVSLKSETGTDIRVDSVSLTPGKGFPDTPRPAAEVEASFFIPEETGIFNDGDTRTVELVIRNHGDARPAAVNWSIFDYQEHPVRSDSFTNNLPARSTTRHALPVADLPWNGYRFACNVDGQPVLGDALAAFLPRVSQDPFPQYGGDAGINPWTKDFTAAWMAKLGMKMGTTLSPGGIIGRWSIVEKTEGQYAWQDETVDTLRRANVELVSFLGLKSPPRWIADSCLKGTAITNEARFTSALCRYADAFTRHYAGRIGIIILEDEIHTAFDTPEKIAQLARIYTAVYDTVHRAASESGTPVAFSLNATYTDWWEKFIRAVGTGRVDFVSQNTNLRPFWSADTLNMMRSNHCFPATFATIGVGQKSLLRGTSLLQDRTLSPGSPPGLFAWQMMMHAWLSRPYGIEDPAAGPLVRYGYYDLRVLGQCIHLPNAGKTGVEYDNSPTLGTQAMAMQKWFLSGRRPVRDATRPFSLAGIPTRHPALMAYPFRDATQAVVVLTTVDSTALDSTWTLTGLTNPLMKPVDLYNRPLAVSNGTAVSVGLPLFIPRIPAAALPDILAACTSVQASVVAPAEQVRLTAGSYTVEVDPDSPGLLKISVLRNGQPVLLIDRFAAAPALPRPTVQVTSGRLASSVSVVFSKVFRMGINVTASGITIDWKHRNSVESTVKQSLRFRVSPAGAGREFLMQEGRVVTAGKLREDYGQLFPAKAIPPPNPSLGESAARVEIRDFARFDLPPATGKGYTPERGFHWIRTDGEAFLESTYELGPYQGGGSRGVQYVDLSLTLTAP